MSKLWQGRTSGSIDENAEKLNKSISFDKRFYNVDITASIAHVAMLAKVGIITKEEKSVLENGLKTLLDDIESGNLVIDESYEDIHSFVEGVLTDRLGSVAKKIHTARSRNDQVALDLHLYIKQSCKTIADMLDIFIKTLKSII